MKSFQLNQRYLRQIFENIQDGIIIMDQTREILLMNPAAHNLTGWLLHDKVPFCTFCQNRTLRPGENKCYLIAREEVPFFLSEMPTYNGNRINVEMSTALMFHDEETNQKEYLLVLRDQSLKKKEEEVRMSKLMIQKLIEAKESEHKRLAQELHDGVGQSLYSISVALQAIESRIQDDRLQNYIDDVRKELDYVMNDVKSYSHQLRPQSLDRLGLNAAVHSMISMLEKNNPSMSFEYSTNIDYRLPSTVEINLYRVIQEATHNITKYSEAEIVSIQLMDHKHKVELSIVDDGKGFDTTLSHNYGLGLHHMEERMAQLGGAFRIDSTPNQGTRITAFVPKGEVFL
ncbi:histidine kinase [Pontibacillus yanchengensis]|uniref:sensor histidine kinase n=1 Tax=Pontibacillus yanchengensis TaxID=462910 RepID=UPI001EFFD930|nr:histidine kinase [Pontibacillus yanchengensis]